MLDLQFICENPDAIAENCRNRGVVVNLDRLLELRDSRNRLIVEGDGLRHRQKELSAEMPKTKEAEKKQSLIAQGKELREQIAANEAGQKVIEAELRAEQARIPNLTHPDAPVGRAVRVDVEPVEASWPLERALQVVQAGRHSSIPVIMRGQLIGLLTLENVSELLMVQEARQRHAGMA